MHDPDVATLYDPDDPDTEMDTRDGTCTIRIHKQANYQRTSQIETYSCHPDHPVSKPYPDTERV